MDQNRKTIANLNKKLKSTGLLFQVVLVESHGSAVAPVAEMVLEHCQLIATGGVSSQKSPTMFEAVAKSIIKKYLLSASTKKRDKL